MGFTEAHRRGNFPGKSRGAFWILQKTVQVLIGKLHLVMGFVCEITQTSGFPLFWGGNSSLPTGLVMPFVSSFCLRLVITTNWVFLKANPGGGLRLHSSAVLKSSSEKPGLREVGGSWCWRGFPMGGDWESTGWGAACPWYSLACGDSVRDGVHRGCPLRSVSPWQHCCHLADTLAPACVASDASCHEGKWHLSRAFLRPAFPARAAESGAGALPSACVLAGADVQREHRRTVTEADEMQPFGLFPATLLACLCHTADPTELSGWIKWL